jgi:spermidine/putrescine transport system ATP-binding protein
VSEASTGAIDLELKGVSKSFGNTVVVRDSSFLLAKGEFLSLLGPSGCGKTTTLAMIAGFERPDAGVIAIRGKRVETLPPERRDIGMVFQSYALFPHMNVDANIGFGLKMRKVPEAEIRERVSAAAELVKVGHLRERYPNELSGGQQQRVALARALVVQPAILLLDEPFGALDRQLREDLQIEVRALLRRLNITTVFVTHDQDEALSMSDRVAVMNEGRIEQIAAPRELYDNPATRFSASFIGKGTFISGVVEGDGRIIETPLGRFGYGGGAALSKGRKADYFLRPEAIEIGDEGGARNRVPASVVAVTFFGDRQLVIAEAAGGVRFIVRLPASRESPAIGRKVDLVWNDKDALAFQ